MPDAVAQPESSAAPLNEIQRVVDTFVAPSKTFTDVLRSSSWWLPFLLMVVVSAGFSFTVQKKVGWATVYDNAINQNPRVKEIISNLPADQQATARERGIARQPYSSYAGSVLVLIFTAIFALLIWPTINFGFGGRATFGKIFTVLMYSNLISYCVRYLLATVALLAGLSADGFNINNPVGTNAGYYLAGGNSPLWLVTMMSFFDICGIWALVVSVIGCSIVGRVKKSSAAIAVFGWWALFMLAITGVVAAFS